MTAAAAASDAGDIIRVRPGTYTEKFTESTSGVSGTEITWVADGAVTLRGGSAGGAIFTVTGDYVRIIGFTFEQLSGEFRGIFAAGADFLEVWNNRFLDFLDGALWTDGGGCATRADNVIFFGNYVRASGNKDLQLRGAANLVAYNESDLNEQDFLYVFGSRHRVLNNYEHDISASAESHTDFEQNGVCLATADLLTEGNFMLDAAGSDHHITNFQDTDAGADRGIWRRNIWHNVGSQGYAISSNNDDYKYYHDTIVRLQSFWTTDPNANYAFYFQGGTPNRIGIKNNAFVQAWSIATTTAETYASGGTGFSSDYNVFYDLDGNINYNATINGETNSQRNTNPGFADLVQPGLDFSISSTGSAAYGTAGPLTLTNGSGTSTVVTVDDATWFVGDDTTINQYGGNLVTGDTITIGTDTCTIQSISGNNITCAETITYADNEPVYFDTDTTPDVGALPYKSGGFSLTGTKSCDGTTCTVTPNDASLVRLVVCYEASIPYAVDNTSPYTCSDPNGAFEARLYPRYASSTLWAVAN